jgi:hypothetical protein
MASRQGEHSGSDPSLLILKVGIEPESILK